PVALLALVKEFAKTSRRAGRRQLPSEVASMLYYLTIGIALSRCDHRLTRLSDPALREGFRWASAQPWADEATRDLLCRAEASIGPGVPAAAPAAVASGSADRRFRGA